MQHKIGIYIRVSTEEQAQVVEGSLQSQQHRMRGFADMKNLQDEKWGKIVETYIDDGYSAKNTNRPAYQRMMREIRAGRINLILVTDISRLSRNILDFCVLLKELDKYKAKFLSIKEQFDTSTPAGEMMIFNMINLAQFERKQTSERISLNFHSRALRGLVNGGNPILGYDKDPANPGKLIVNKDEASLVERVFELYLETGSLSGTARKLSQECLPRKDWGTRKFRHVSEGRWTVHAVRHILKNKAYMGMREINKANKDKDPSELKTWHRHQIVKASWPAILPTVLFHKVQEALEHSREKEKNRLDSAERRVFLLSSLLRCGSCGRALIGQSAHGSKQVHRYYGHKTVTGEVVKCPEKRFNAQEIEDAVVQHLDEVIFRAGRLDAIEANLRVTLGDSHKHFASRSEILEKEIKRIDSEIEGVFRLVSSLPEAGSGAELVRERIETLASKKKNLIQSKDAILASGSNVVDSKEARAVIEERVADFKRGWKKATPANQKRLMRRVFNRLVYTADGIKAFFVVNKDQDHAGVSENEKGTLGLSPGVPFSSALLPTGLFLSQRSSVVEVGGFDYV